MTSEPIDIITPVEECATIKCDHHGIWEGGAGSLCIAPAGPGRSGVRQEDLPIPVVLMYSTAMQWHTKTVLSKSNNSTIFGMWWNKMHFLCEISGS